MNLYWQPLSVIVSLLFNVNRNPKKQKAIGPEDVNPYVDRKALAASKKRDILVDNTIFFSALRKRFYKEDTKCKTTNSSSKPSSLDSSAPCSSPKPS